MLESVLSILLRRYPNFGGVMGWEYLIALHGGAEKPWEWAANMGRVFRTPLQASNPPAGSYSAAANVYQAVRNGPSSAPATCAIPVAGRKREDAAGLGLQPTAGCRRFQYHWWERGVCY